jgi:hypothetical protein
MSEEESAETSSLQNPKKNSIHIQNKRMDKHRAMGLKFYCRAG